MIELITDNDAALSISPSNGSDFVKWILDYLKEPTELTRFEINGIIANFDRRGHEECIFRASLIEWLYSNTGRIITAVSNEC